MKIKLVGQTVFGDASGFAPKKTFFRRKCGTAKPHFFTRSDHCGMLHRLRSRSEAAKSTLSRMGKDALAKKYIRKKWESALMEQTDSTLGMSSFSQLLQQHQNHKVPHRKHRTRPRCNFQRQTDPQSGDHRKMHP